MIIVLPFCEKSPMFCSKKFFCVLNFLRRESKRNFFILCFYSSNGYRKTQNALVVHNGKVVCFFGENFTNKSFEIKIYKKVKFVFDFDFYRRKFNCFVAYLSSESKPLILDYQRKKFKKGFCIINKS